MKCHVYCRKVPALLSYLAAIYLWTPRLSPLPCLLFFSFLHYSALFLWFLLFSFLLFCLFSSFSRLSCSPSLFPTSHGVNCQLLSLISFAPPSGLAAHNITQRGKRGRRARNWWNSSKCEHTSFIPDCQPTLGFMNLCITVLEFRWIF